MSEINLVFSLTDTKTLIGSLQLDALIKESTSLNSKVTKYAVEEGSPISDHISNESEQLVIDGVITGATVTLMGEAGRSKLILTKEALRLLHQQRQPITVVTGMDMYTDFVIESCEIERNNDDGEQLNVNLSLTAIRKATVKTTDVPDGKVKPKAKGKAGETRKSGGKVTNTKSKSSTVSRSTASKTTPSPKAAEKAKEAAKASGRKSSLANILGGGL